MKGGESQIFRANADVDWKCQLASIGHKNRVKVAALPGRAEDG